MSKLMQKYGSMQPCRLCHPSAMQFFRIFHCQHRKDVREGSEIRLLCHEFWNPPRASLSQARLTWLADVRLRSSSSRTSLKRVG